MAALDASSLYRSIIDTVVSKSRHEFVQEGVDEAVLDELRVLWEEKLQQTGALAAEAPRALSGSQLMTSQQPGQHVASYYGSQTQFPGQQLGRPSTYYSQALNAAQPQAYPGFPGGRAAIVQSGGQQRPAQSLAAQPSQHLAGFQSLYAQQRPAAASAHAPQLGQPQAYLPNPQQPVQPQAQFNVYQQLQQYAQHHPQQHAQRVQQPLQQHVQPATAVPGSLDDVTRKRRAEEELAAARAKQGKAEQQGGIPQQDGPADDAAVNGEQEGAEQAEEEAADNLSDVSSGADEADEEEVPNHCISQFTKVTRAKNRWKAQLTAGILHLNGRDHVFSAANGDMEF